MRRFGFGLGLVAAFALALVAGTSVPASAEWVPVPLVYKFLGVGPTMTAACADALEALEERCIFHGNVTYDRGRCISSTLPLGGETVTICDCTAQTSICVQPFPGIPN